ncbi:AAA family ATPase [Haloarculaceae archaeon H-GB2-1]|nr:AAA family ATPase [Haloarculaceae archaeon H-GB1-1]MEA5408094.1 AAA family ATPase [Haloarculaceae archaeon H-GB2-1]
MDLTERIERRRNHRYENRLVVDWDALNPAVHLSEPVGREFVFEAILDAADPIFDGQLPPNVYVWGPAGSGKSAIVTSLYSALQQTVSRGQRTFHTATRADSLLGGFHFVYVDTRRTASRFKLYQQLLNALVDDKVPERGIGTGELEDRLQAELASADGLLVGVDHVDMDETLDIAELREFLAPFPKVRWTAVGRTPPDDLDSHPPEVEIQVPSYNYEIVDILTTRGTSGLSKGLDHTQAKALAEWSDGNAHDALAALFGAASVAEADDAKTLRDEDLEAGKEAVPKGGVPIGRVLTLPENKQLVLRTLLDVSDSEQSIDTAADAIAAETDLSPGTVRRYIYELAQHDVLERREVAVETGTAGRRPSGAVPRFPTLVFERLHSGT